MLQVLAHGYDGFRQARLLVPGIDGEVKDKRASVSQTVGNIGAQEPAVGTDEPVGVGLSKSLKRRAPFANIAQASAFMSGSTEFVALSSSLPASCWPNLHHITPQRNT